MSATHVIVPEPLKVYPVIVAFNTGDRKQQKIHIYNDSQ
jgi:hypothetical protein